MIVKDLQALPAPALKEAARYIHSLREVNQSAKKALPPEERSRILRETSGAWSSADADAIEQAIEEGCEKVDPSGW